MFSPLELYAFAMLKTIFNSIEKGDGVLIFRGTAMHYNHLAKTALELYGLNLVVFSSSPIKCATCFKIENPRLPQIGDRVYSFSDVPSIRLSKWHFGGTWESKGSAHELISISWSDRKGNYLFNETPVSNND